MSYDFQQKDFMNKQQEQLAPDASVSVLETPKISEERLMKMDAFKNTESGQMRFKKMRKSVGGRSFKMSTAKYIPPPFNMKKLGQMPDLSAMLDVSIDAMETNVTGFGFELQCLLDTKEIIDEDGNRIVVDANTEEPIPEETLKAKDLEMEKLSALFASAALDDNEGILGVFKKKTRDVETFGNAWLEIERNDDNEIVGIHHLKAWSMRLMKKQDPLFVEDIEVKNPATLDYFKVDRHIKFRKHIQISDGGKKKKFFKDFGDPRIMNSLDGEYYDDIKSVPTENFQEATEVIHYKLYHPMHEYGVPRWISATPSVLSVRAAQLLNHGLLTNNGIPMGLLIVEGHNSKELETKINEEINAKIRGGDSFHALLVVQAEASKAAVGPAAKSTKPSIRLEKLTDMVHQEGLFINYSKFVDEVIVGTFRLPNILVGKIKDINRSVAEVSLQIAEEQVFGPERTGHDFVINTKIFQDMKIKYWEYKTRPAKLENLEKIAEIVNKFVETGVIVPREGRSIASQVMNKKLGDIDQPFMEMPVKVFLEQMRLESAEMNSVQAPIENDPVVPNPIDESADEQTDDMPDEVIKVMKLSETDKEDLVIQFVQKLLSVRDGLDVRATHLIKLKENAA